MSISELTQKYLASIEKDIPIEVRCFCEKMLRNFSNGKSFCDTEITVLRLCSKIIDGKKPLDDNFFKYFDD